MDRSVLHLIRLWLRTPVWEAAEGKEENQTIQRSQRGTPQGGVISPLLANIYLHWFDVLFHRTAGPAVKYGAKLVRYADDCVPRAQRAERACSVSLLYR